MLQAFRRIRKIEDGAVAQVFTEARTIDFLHHPSGGGLRMLLEKSADIAVGSHASNSSSRQELFPYIRRLRRKTLSHFSCEFGVVSGSGGGVCEACIREQVRPVCRRAESLPFALEYTGQEDPTFAGRIQTIKRVEPVALLIG